MNELDDLITEKSNNFKNFLKSIVEDKYIEQITELPIDLSEKNLGYIKTFLVLGGTSKFLADSVSLKFGIKSEPQVEKIKEYVDCLLKLILTKMNI